MPKGIGYGKGKKIKKLAGKTKHRAESKLQGYETNHADSELAKLTKGRKT